MTFNIFFLFMAVFLIYKLASGFQRGMVRELVSFISLIFLCVVSVLVGKGIERYFAGEILRVILVVVLLGILGVIHQSLGFIVIPAKIVSKLPILRGIDKLLGIGMGALETVIFLWTIYTFIMMIDLGMTGAFLRSCVFENSILTWFYDRNQVVGLVRYCVGQLHQVMPGIF